MSSENTAKRLSSSLRSRTAEESLVLAKSIAKSRGISRVVDTTRLDRIGVPVYASIRPDGADGAVWVHAGKGFTHNEAKIGAYMEAIEFSFAEPVRNGIPWELRKPAEILASFQNGITFPDFAARIGSRIEPDDLVAVVQADEIFRGLGTVQLPAELVFHPFPQNTGTRLYGTSTNGLASGNTLTEATVHGLAEVMERHVKSFENVDNKTLWVTPNGLPQKIRLMADMIEKAGLSWHLRYYPNPFGMAYFSAYVLEPDERHPIAVAAGHGFHPIREIAAVRALAEAVQSRLTVIHGGREDIIKQVNSFSEMGVERTLQTLRLRQRQVADTTRQIAYAEIPDFESDIESIEDALQCLYRGLTRADLHHVARVTFTAPDYPFQVVKVVVPGAEMFLPESPRVGPRLLKHVQNA